MLPQDPNMLYSYLNTQLRDTRLPLESLCEYLDLDYAEVCARLSAAGLRYEADSNRIVAD